MTVPIAHYCAACGKPIEDMPVLSSPPYFCRGNKSSVGCRPPKAPIAAATEASHLIRHPRL